MKKYHLTMMCVSCKWKITEALKKKGYDDFHIDMESSKLTFYEDVNDDKIIRIVNDAGYKIDPVDVVDEMSDEELAMLEDALRNGYSLDD